MNKNRRKKSIVEKIKFKIQKLENELDKLKKELTEQQSIENQINNTNDYNYLFKKEENTIVFEFN